LPAGAVVPIPTFPVASIRTLSVVLVANTSGVLVRVARINPFPPVAWLISAHPPNVMPYLEIVLAEPCTWNPSEPQFAIAPNIAPAPVPLASEDVAMTPLNVLVGT